MWKPKANAPFRIDRLIFFPKQANALPFSVSSRLGAPSIFLLCAQRKHLYSRFHAVADSMWFNSNYPFPSLLTKADRIYQEIAHRQKNPTALPLSVSTLHSARSSFIHLPVPSSVHRLPPQRSVRFSTFYTIKVYHVTSLLGKSNADTDEHRNVPFSITRHSFEEMTLLIRCALLHFWLFYCP